MEFIRKKPPKASVPEKGDSIAFGSEGMRRSTSKRNLLLARSSILLDDEDIPDSQPEPHVKARSHPGRKYPQRFPVSDEQVPWDASYPEYKPPAHIEPSVLAASGPGGWADAAEPSKEGIEERGSHELQARQLRWSYDAQGRPLNPRGRTGIADRGALGRWGPNHAGDAVVTRHRRKPASGKDDAVSGGAGGSSEVIALEMVAIRRKDTGEWAIPGGMQDPGEVGFQVRSVPAVS